MVSTISLFLVKAAGAESISEGSELDRRIYEWLHFVLFDTFSLIFILPLMILSRILEHFVVFFQ